MIRRTNRHCKYFPCHSGLEDCAFCYCPFYPCGDKRRGGEWLSAKNGAVVWSCQGCLWIHKKDTVDKIFSLIAKGGFPRPGQRPEIKTKGDNAGVIILAHGSRVKKANSLVGKIADMLSREIGLPARAAYLQLCRPGLEETVKALCQKGCRKIIIVPFFLFVGNHVRRDIPRVIRGLKKKYLHTTFVYTENLGQDPRIRQIVLERILGAVKGSVKVSGCQSVHRKERKAKSEKRKTRARTENRNQ
ncbi:MAG: CbiX/SirB N-terminal domain-containing protein [Candidatus Omnitrophota bacterium]